MLNAREEEIDRHLKYIKQNLKTTTTEPINRDFAYITRDDLLAIYGEDTVLTIRNHKEIFKPGLMQEDDKVVLDRALIIVSEDALDVRLVSHFGDAFKTDSQRSTDSGISFSSVEIKKRRNSFGLKEAISKRKRTLDESVSDDELSNELEASAQVVLGKDDVHEDKIGKETEWLFCCFMTLYIVNLLKIIQHLFD